MRPGDPASAQGRSIDPVLPSLATLVEIWTACLERGLLAWSPEHSEWRLDWENLPIEWKALQLL
jgi:hypothetical protein